MITVAARIDPIELELFRNACFAIADEMAVTITRTAFSSVVRDNMDFSTALADASGLVVAQGLTIAGHLGSIPAALAAVIARFGERMGPGDVFILNDPYEGGMHLPDIFVFRPVFLGARRVGFTATVCHHTDVGGRVAGSNASDSTEIFQEGLRLAPMRLYEAGRVNDTLMTVIERNVRLPDKVFGDLRAQAAACASGERQLLELVARYGEGETQALMAALVGYAERMTRAAIRALPDGRARFEDHIDDDGVELDKPIRLAVEVVKRGDHITVDWTGSASQVKGAINSTLSYTRAASYCAVRSILAGDIPANEGMFRAIDVIAPEGTIVNLLPPAACAARGLTGFRMLDCLFGALARFAPDKVYAASNGGVTGISIGGYREDRSPFIYVEFSAAAWGGRPRADGVDGISNPMSNLSLPSAEQIEAEQPLHVLCSELVPDRGGAGKHRGGMAMRRAFRLLEREAVLQVRSDRRRFRPYGLFGGGAGEPSLNVIESNGKRRICPAKLTTTLKHGDIFTHETAGAGGWGDPLERDPAAVVMDVRGGLVSRLVARRIYGVVLEPGAWRADDARTRALRTRLKRTRKAERRR